MITKPPKYAYVIAIVLGLVVFFIPTTEAFSFSVPLVYLFVRGLFGFLWPSKSWRWGFWIAGPMIAFLGLSVLFGGQLDVFVKKDLVPFIISITAACLGSFISAFYKQRRKYSRH